MNLTTTQLIQAHCRLLLAGNNTREDLIVGIQRIYDMLEVQRKLEELQTDIQDEAFIQDVSDLKKLDITDIDGINVSDEANT